MIKHFYTKWQVILPLLFFVCHSDFSIAQSTLRVWGLTQSPTGGSVFYVNTRGISRSLVTDSISKVGMNPTFLFQGRNGYLYGVTSTTSASSDGVLFRINEKGAAKLCSIPSPIGKSAHIVEGNESYFYGVGQAVSGTNSMVFKVKTDGSGFISRKIQTYAFHGRGGLIRTSSGKIIGMSESGGNNGQGFIYELRPDLSIQILFHFEKAGGKRPFGNLIEDGGFLYGLTNSGGSYNYGAIFRIREDGTDYATLHHFNLTNGAYPMGGLSIHGGYAYGSTNKGGTHKKGTIFRIRLDGSGYKIVYHFNGSEGEFPQGDLLINPDATLTGVAGGGQGNQGVLFTLNTDGSGYRIIHSFQGESPMPQLTPIKESWLPVIALTTPLAGSTNAAVHGIYRSRAELEGRSYTLQLSEDPAFGRDVRTITNSSQQFDLGNSYLKFSTTYYGRVCGGVWPVFGPVTSFKTRSASDYAVVTQPADQAVNVSTDKVKVTVGLIPGAKRYVVQLSTQPDFSRIELSDSSAKEGQRSFVFAHLSFSKKYFARVKSDISSFGKTTSFTTESEPVVTVTLPHGMENVDPSMFAVDCSTVPGALKYTLQISTASDFSGATTRVSVRPGQNSFVITDLQHEARYFLRALSDRSAGYGPVAQITTRAAVEQKRLWGVTTRGGESGLGTIFSFSIDSGSFTKHLDYYNPADYVALTGSLIQTPEGFAGLSVADGTGGGEVFTFSNEGLKLLEDYGPHQGSVMLGSDNYLYILDDWINLFRGGIYKIHSAGDSVNVFDRIIFRFSSDNQGINPAARLLQHANGYLYGCTSEEGQYDKGTLFRLKMDGSGFEVIHHFNGSDGANANTPLIAGADGYLYGVASAGGASDLGVLYRILPDGTRFKVIHHFNGTTGANPQSALTWANGKLYGTATNGGLFGNGLVFVLGPDGVSFTPLHHFDGTAGANPRGHLTIDGSIIYGTTSAGGTSDLGTIFSMNANGTGFVTLMNFTRESGGAPDGGLLLMEDTFYPGSTAITLAFESSEDEAVRIYPNPFTDTFTAEWTRASAQTRYVVRDLSGNVRLSVTGGDSTSQLGEQLEKGIYLLTVEEADRKSTHRLVKY